MQTTTTTTFLQQCEQVASLADQLQSALNGLKPQLGDLPNHSLVKIANEVVKARGADRTPAPANPPAIDAAMATNGITSTPKKVKPNDATRALEGIVRKVARTARDHYQGKEFAMADLSELLKVGSRTLIPSFNSLEKRGLFKKTGTGKRNGQEVNLYRVGKELTRKTT